MSVDPQLRTLEIDIPAKPDALVKLSLLLAEDEVNQRAIASLVETDMALAAAVMKAVNSSLYGLDGRVSSVQQAITYLGTREVAGITFEMGLRAAFPPTPELEPIWQRAAQRGLLMGRLAQALGQDAWAAHSAGLFEECGKAVLFRHAPDHYRAMLRAAAMTASCASWSTPASASATTRWAPRCARAGAWGPRRSPACATMFRRRRCSNCPCHRRGAACWPCR